MGALARGPAVVCAVLPTENAVSFKTKCRHSAPSAVPAISDKEALGLLAAVALHELVDAAFRVHHSLLTGVVRMACGADVAGHSLHGGTRLNHVTASAGNGCVFVLRMNVFLHWLTPFNLKKCLCIITHLLPIRQ